MYTYIYIYNSYLCLYIYRYMVYTFGHSWRRVRRSLLPLGNQIYYKIGEPTDHFYWWESWFPVVSSSKLSISGEFSGRLWRLLEQAGFGLSGRENHTWKFAILSSSLEHGPGAKKNHSKSIFKSTNVEAKMYDKQSQIGLYDWVCHLIGFVIWE